MVGISAKAEYAVLAVLHLATNATGTNLIQLEEISEKRKIPREFLVQIMSLLGKSGVVSSKRGVGGGYYLVKKPADILLSHIIESVDGAINEFQCEASPSYCLGVDSCALFPIWTKICDFAKAEMSKVNFEQLASSKSCANA